MRKLLLQVNRKLTVIAALFIVVLIGAAGTTAPTHQDGFKNLKILPKDISKEALHDIMQNQFGDALGVRCDYCHAKQPGSDHPDFASDANEKKEIARYMMNMVLQLNKDNFKLEKPMIGDSLMVVTCYTCHHGATKPDTKSKIPVVHNWGPPKPPPADSADMKKP